MRETEKSMEGSTLSPKEKEITKKEEEKEVKGESSII
jgi:hypothetical protein